MARVIVALLLAAMAAFAVATLVPSFDVCDAVEGAAESAICDRCYTLGVRGGCSACESFGGACKWFYYPDAPEQSACGAGTLTEARILAEDGAVVIHAPLLCPKDPRNATHLPYVPPVENKNYEDFFPKAYSSISSFCEFPTDPYFVDTFAHSNEPHWTVDDPEGEYPRLCEISRTAFGLWTTGNVGVFTAETRAFTKADLVTLSANCPVRGPTKRDVEDEEVATPGSSRSPLKTLVGRECVRAMQAAYCTTACPAYGVAEGLLCPNRNKDYLYRVCAPWTAGPSAYKGIPLKNNCPLDPNNLPWDTVNDAFCDDDTFRLQGSGLFEHVFGLHDPLPKPEP